MADTFEIDVTRWVEQARVRSQVALGAIAQDVLARVRELTPVDTGNLRANWQVVVAGDERDVLRISATGTEARPAKPDQDTALPLSFKIGDTLLIVNPVVYARRIEFGFVGDDSRGRHYNQVGRGMMQQTIAEMPQIAAKAIERVGGGRTL